MVVKVDSRRWALDPALLLEAVPSATFALDQELRLRSGNGAAEQLFSTSWNHLAGRRLEELLTAHATLLALVRQVQAESASFSEYGLELALAPRGGAPG